MTTLPSPSRTQSSPVLGQNFRTLQADSIVRTTEKLHRRIVERFPNRNLRFVSAELVQIATEARARIDEYSKPNYLLRSLTILLLIAFTVAAALVLRNINLAPGELSLVDWLEVLEAGINDVLFLAAAIYFLVTLEQRLKQRKIRTAMQELRTLAHIIDAFQLTKDPQRITHRGPDTESSPQETLNAFELTRYLDYCSEMLSLTGKLGALYAQSDTSDATVAAVNEIELLTSGLAAKIWQKLMTVYQLLEIESEAEAARQLEREAQQTRNAATNTANIKDEGEPTEE